MDSLLAFEPRLGVLVCVLTNRSQGDPAEPFHLDYEACIVASVKTRKERYGYS